MSVPARALLTGQLFLASCAILAKSSAVTPSAWPRTVTADVTLGPDPAGGFRISGITLTVRGQAEGVAADDFAKIAQEAKNNCPVSKALTGTDITLQVNPG